ncbi:hypothetical protein DFJ58DRAFT_263416 [Suillus subalutaceus]|uniref:uncharacterized protein n=1 Tax=Suillus subalutaceus TaxID=48586 RepID=UPI001B86FFF7|nr:uncharacterized protein DFJ58DRAFT_263416 [Suillus subalutaceus]KAG1861112.1 hypothetical protein DFJ58DRAFT_263416 [Suillus subalutaceus]
MPVTTATKFQHDANQRLHAHFMIRKPDNRGRERTTRRIARGLRAGIVDIDLSMCSSMGRTRVICLVCVNLPYFSQLTSSLGLACRHNVPSIFYDTLKLRMTIVSNDPIWWPSINSDRVSSYFGVAAFIGVTYEWGEHDHIKELLIAYKYLQHLHSDKRYVDAMTGTAMSLSILGFIG